MKRRVFTVRRLVIGKGPTATESLVHWAQHVRIEKGNNDVDAPMAIVGVHGAQPFDWQNMQEELRLGQSAEALELKEAKSLPLAGKFARVKDLQDNMQLQKLMALRMSKGIEINGQVVKIKKYDWNEIVVTVALPDSQPLEIVTDELIVAMGAGRERSVVVPTQKRTLNIERPFGEYITGSQGVSIGLMIERGCVVLIVGDGPTALWAAEVCLSYGAIPYVVGPNNGRAFRNANPGGRNSETLKILIENDLLFTADIEGFEERDQLDDFSDMREAGILAYLKNVTHFSTGVFKSQKVLPVCRVVSAIGTSPASMSYFDPHIVGDFAPLVAEGLEGQAAVGIATTDRDIVLVGAQAHSIGVGMGLNALFDAQGLRIGQPPPGILTNRSSIRGLMREYGRIKLGAQASEMNTIQALFINDELDVMTANHAELSHFLQIKAGVSKVAAGEMAVKVIEVRNDYIKRNRDFTMLDFAKLLRKMEVNMPGKNEYYA